LATANLVASQEWKIGSHAPNNNSEKTNTCVLAICLPARVIRHIRGIDAVEAGQCNVEHLNKRRIAAAAIITQSPAALAAVSCSTATTLDLVVTVSSSG
jgi:hypothetical protein